MSDLLPKGEDLRRAIRWISSESQANPSAKRFDLIREAELRFDLSPRDSEFLLRFYRDADRAAAESGTDGKDAGDEDA